MFPKSRLLENLGLIIITALYFPYVPTRNPRNPRFTLSSVSSGNIHVPGMYDASKYEKLIEYIIKANKQKLNFRYLFVCCIITLITALSDIKKLQ